MKIYSFVYNPMIEESVYCVISLHFTEKGAKKALKNHRNEEYKEWEKHNKWERKEYGDNYEKLKGSSFGFRNTIINNKKIITINYGKRNKYQLRRLLKSKRRTNDL